MILLAIDFGIPLVEEILKNYFYLFLLVFGGLWETVTIFLGVYQSSLGEASLFLALPAVFLSTWIWNNGLYWTGRLGGNSILEKYLAGSKIEKYTKYLEWNFESQIFLWQFMGPPKAALIYASGWKEIDYSKFCLYYTCALAVWHTFLFGLSSLLLHAGYGLAESLGFLKTFTRSLVAIVVGIVIIGLGVHMLSRFVWKSFEVE